MHCSSCNRGLCSSCDHRIKGAPYCQDCIVAGIQSLQRGAQTEQPYQHHYQNHYQGHDQNRYRGRGAASGAGRALLAALCALLPGGGAIYNRQNIKAIFQFVAVVALAQLANLPPLRFLILGMLLVYFHSILDAYRTARAIAAGESAAENEERFKRALIKRAPAIGVGLLVAGLLVFIRLVQPLSPMLSFSRLAPVALILFGGYLLTRYFKQSREGKPDYGQGAAYQLASGRFSQRQRDRAANPVNDASRFGR